MLGVHTGTCLLEKSAGTQAQEGGWGPSWVLGLLRAPRAVQWWFLLHLSPPAQIDQLICLVPSSLPLLTAPYLLPGRLCNRLQWEGPPPHSLTCALTLAHAFPFSCTYNLADLTQRHVLTGSHTFSHLTQLQSLTQTIMMASSFPFFQPQSISPPALWVRSSYVRPPVTLHCLFIGTGAWHWH